MVSQFPRREHPAGDMMLDAVSLLLARLPRPHTSSFSSRGNQTLLYWERGAISNMEVAGVEPASLEFLLKASTGLYDYLNSPVGRESAHSPLGPESGECTARTPGSRIGLCLLWSSSSPSRCRLRYGPDCGGESLRNPIRLVLLENQRGCDQENRFRSSADMAHLPDDDAGIPQRPAECPGPIGIELGAVFVLQLHSPASVRFLSLP